MKHRREDLLLDLARVIRRHGADEVLELVRAMRDGDLMRDLADLLEGVATAVPKRPRGRTVAPTLSRKRTRVRAALREGYSTMEALEPLLRRVGLANRPFESVEDAQRAIMRCVDGLGDARDIEDEILEGSVRAEGELGQLADAIVSKPRKK